MPYKIDRNPVTKRSRLSWYPTPSGKVAPRKTTGQHDRSVVVVGGRKLHLTKGWRS